MQSKDRKNYMIDICREAKYLYNKLSAAKYLINKIKVQRLIVELQIATVVWQCSGKSI